MVVSPLWIAADMSLLMPCGISNERRMRPSRASGVTRIGSSADTTATATMMQASSAAARRTCETRLKPSPLIAPSFLRVQQILEFAHELADVAEVTIHRREPNVCDF